MEPKVNYTLVGVFVLGLSFALVTGIVWLSADTAEHRYRTYVAYMYESVSGLRTGAAVSYRGVEVGRVQKISLDKYNPERVELLLDIDEDTPVKEDTVATIVTQGLTGIAHLELTGGSSASPALEAKPDQPYPEIETRPSLLVRLDMAVSNLLSQLSKTAQQMGSVAERVGTLLDDDKQRSIADTLKNVEKLTGALALRADDLNDTIGLTTTVMKNAVKASEELPALVDNMSGSFSQLQQAIGSINHTTSHLDELINRTQEDLAHFSRGALPSVNPLLVELTQLTESLRRVTQDLERHPNSLLFGHPRLKPGPGE